MALVTVTATTPTVELLTRPQVISRYLRGTGFGQTGTVTATGTVSQVIDTTRLLASVYQHESLRGWVRVSTTTDNAAPVGEIRAISSSGYDPNQGIIEVVPNFSVALDTGDTYEVHFIIHPQDVLDHIDDICKNDYYLPTWSVLSELDDGDMEQSVTAAWTAVNATMAKRTTEPSMTGKRWMRVTLSADGGYIKSATTVKVDAGGAYSISALACPAGASYDATLILYDETNSANIKTWNYTGETRVRIQENIVIPSTCHAVTVRLSGTSNGNVCDWDDVSLLHVSSRDVPLPWWVRDAAQVKAVFNWRPSPIAAVGSASHVYAPELDGRQTRDWEPRDSAFGGGQLRLASRVSSLTGLMYIYGKRNEEAFSSDIESKHLDANYTHAALLNKIYASLSGLPASGTYNIKWITAQADKWEKEYRKEQYKQAQRVESVLSGPTPTAFYG
jgi:hypothetical protein